MQSQRFVPSGASHRGVSPVRSIVAAAFTMLSLFVVLSACDNGRPVNEPPGVGAACLARGDHCEYDNQCCSHRCYHETGCTGGTP